MHLTKMCPHEFLHNNLLETFDGNAGQSVPSFPEWASDPAELAVPGAFAERGSA